MRVVTYSSLGVLLAAAGWGAPLLERVEGGQSRLSVKEDSLHPRSPERKELLRLMDQLAAKLPPELARKLIVISMKLATGYCSPYAARELEEAIAEVPDSARKSFEGEWKLVREHPHWPRMPHDGEGPGAGGKTGRSGDPKQGPS